MNTLLGSKLKMTQFFEEGMRKPVTLVETGPCVVTQIIHYKNRGFWSVQLGFGTKKLKNTSKPLQGHLKATIKSEKAPHHLKEIKVTEEPTYKVGDIVTLADIFTKGDTVTVTGISKGKGFAGGVKRWGFRGGPKTHGQSDRLRAPGSIGQGTTPGRVYKGKHMAGRMGSDQVTIKNLEIVNIDSENGTLAISGAIPGHPGTLIMVKRTSENKVVPTQADTGATSEEVTTEVEGGANEQA
jgi:large subunit ribosomal protein L3